MKNGPVARAVGTLNAASLSGAARLLLLLGCRLLSGRFLCSLLCRVLHRSSLPNVYKICDRRIAV
jgi:hypothetical protein